MTQGFRFRGAFANDLSTSPATLSAAARMGKWLFRLTMPFFVALIRSFDHPIGSVRRLLLRSF
jgi:hypothetical protein